MTGLLLGDKNDMNGLAGKTQLLRCTTFVASRRSTYLVLARLASSRATTDCYVRTLRYEQVPQVCSVGTSSPYVHLVRKTIWLDNRSTSTFDRRMSSNL